MGGGARPHSMRSAAQRRAQALHSLPMGARRPAAPSRPRRAACNERTATQPCSPRRTLEGPTHLQEPSPRTQPGTQPPVSRRTRELARPGPTRLMHIKVKNQHSSHLAGLQQGLRGHRKVVEHAEAAARGAGRVVRAARGVAGQPVLQRQLRGQQRACRGAGAGARGGVGRPGARAGPWRCGAALACRKAARGAKGSPCSAAPPTTGPALRARPAPLRVAHLPPRPACAPAAPGCWSRPQSRCAAGARRRARLPGMRPRTRPHAPAPAWRGWAARAA